MNRKALALAALFASVALAAPVAAQQAPAQPWRNTSLSPEQRATALVSQMTLEEKAAQLGNFAPAIPRLGVPAYGWWNEGLHGVARAGIATVFPQAIGMAATWDQPLMHEVAGTIGVEFRAKYVATRHPDGGADWYRGLTVWSPNINIFRDPRWGRGQETYGEDPYLTGRIGIAFIRGLQGDDPKYFQTIATSKHYVVHSGPESTRHKTDVHPSRHDLEDTYLPAFRATVTEANVRSIMCAYNAIDGVPACANTNLLQHVLRGAWGFKGYVVSDCGAAANIYRPDALHYVKTPEEGVTLAFKAGMDIICGDFRNNWTTEQGPIVNAVRRGMMPEAVIDRSLRRLFEARIRLGLFDPPSQVFPAISAADNDTAAHRALSLKMAEDSMVLLKNEGNALPLRAAPRTIAVIGPNADSLDALIGNYYGTPSRPVTVLDGLRARFPQSNIVFVQGTGLIGPAEPPVPDSALCADADCHAHGLKAESFAGVDLKGAPTATSMAPNAAFTWRGDRESAMRWTGFITPPASGEYSFRVLSQNGYRVWIGDKMVTDEWGVGDAPSIVAGKIALEGGHSYPIRVEAFQRGARGEQYLVWSTPEQNGDKAVEAARKADLVVFVGGLSARIEGEEMKVEAPGFSGGDRTSIDLPGPQEQLLERVQATGKPLVLVLMNGSALGVNWADAHVPAIVEAWYPGEEGGDAVARLIAGDYSPAGRLPITFYKSVDQLPAFDDYAMAGRTYRYFKGEALYPFGYGLSYTSFHYSNVRPSAAAVPANGAVAISADVTNSGSRDGDEVVELYLAHPGAAGAPIRALAGFQRIHLKAGETRHVAFTLKDRALSIVDPQGVRRIEAGPVEAWVGGGQPASRAGLPQTAGGGTRFRITGNATLAE
ncbi:MAG TPA: glycoside hydrolase family 3 C-terminal domain-containing protein [Allosphingosinicella sp.]|jgi:beta-glucosidase